MASGVPTTPLEHMDIHPNLAPKHVIDNTWFLYYCFCVGAGLGPVNDPLVGGEAKVCCIRSMANTTEVMGEDGLCKIMSSVLCITQNVQFPPKDWTPKCICFNKTLAPGAAPIPSTNGMFDYKKIFEETFWLYYIFCFGVGVNGLGAGGRPLFGSSGKEFCAAFQAGLEEPVKDGIICEGTETCLCLWAQLQFPPKIENPKFGLCGWRLNKKEEARNLPGAVEMS